MSDTTGHSPTTHCPTIVKQTPCTSISRPNADDTSVLSSSRKRKRSQQSSRAVWPSAPEFHIASGLADDSTLIPIRVLLSASRAQLPLSFLDSSTSASHDTFLTARLPCFEKSPAFKDVELNPKIVIANVGDSGGLCVIERVQGDVYALSALRRDVGLSQLKALPTVAKHEFLTPPRINGDKPCDWWHAAVLDDARIDKISDHSTEPSRSPRRYPIAEPEILSRLPVISTPQDHGSISEAGDSVEAIVMTTDKPFEALCEALVNQYLVALYLSKTSLAYFAKGPLSRARAVSYSYDDMNDSHIRLSDFLRTMVVSSVTTDNKYQNILPQIIANIPQGSSVEAEGKTRPSQRQDKSEKVKVPKLHKNGTYSVENQYVEKYWNNAGIAVSKDLFNELFSANLAPLKFRETLMQVLLILEVLAIEATERWNITQARVNGESQPQLCGTQKAMHGKRSKRKKVVNLALLLDTLIDRLCIWQSINTSADETRVQPFMEIEAQEAEAARAGEATSVDCLKEFCNHVLIPFYSSRLPSVVSSLLQKAGVSLRGLSCPAGPSSTVDAKRKVIPGSEIRRKRPTSAGNSLHRISSDNRRTHIADAPSLIRSLTDSNMETSHSRQNGVPASTKLFDHSRRSISRSQSVSNPGRMNQREVDMTVISKFNEGKARKKAKVEEELRDAITALKKPNRGLVTSDYFRTADKLVLAPGNQQKTLPAHRKSKLAVQVGATPTKDRTSQIENLFDTASILGQREDEDKISSTNPFHPPMILKPRLSEQHYFERPRPPVSGNVTPQRIPMQSDVLGLKTNSGIASTPSVNRTKFHHSSLEGDAPIVSEHVGANQAQNFPGGIEMLSETPMRQPRVIGSTPAKSSRYPDGGSDKFGFNDASTSIYYDLGWMYDNDDLM